MTVLTPAFVVEQKAASLKGNRFLRLCRTRPGAMMGGLLLVVILALAFFAPYLTTSSPMTIFADDQLVTPSPAEWFGTDQMGRSVYARVLYGSRVSLLVGFAVAISATGIGLIIGMVAGFLRWADTFIMRIMDGIMAIPGILLAIALMSLTEASVKNVIIAISIPEIPRVVRLVRSLVLSLREQLFVEAAISAGSSISRVIFRHILPCTLAPLAVQASYVCASAIINEAYLSFLGAGTPPEIPSWGNIMAEGRDYFSIAPWLIVIPGIFTALTVLSMNVMGDGLRDMMDPRVAKKL